MKKISVLILSLLCFFLAQSQTGDVRGDRVIANKSLTVRNTRVDTVKNDTVGIKNTSHTILTGKAVYDLVIGRMGSGSTIDTSGKWVYNITRRHDSVFIAKGGALVFAYKDSVGTSGGVADGGIHKATASFGLINVNDSTLKADTSALVSKQSRDKLSDSLNSLIALRVKISDTASMLNGYPRRGELKDTAAAIRLAKVNVADTASMLTGYVRINVLKDTAAQLRASISSGGGGPGNTDTTLQKITDKGSTTTNSITVGKKDSIGYRYTYGWATTPLDAAITDNTPSATVTTDGVKTIISGGAFNLSNYLEWAFKTGMDNWTIEFSVQVEDKSNTSRGFALAVNPSVGGAIMAHFLGADTAGYVVYTPTVALPTMADVNNKFTSNFKWSLHDRLNIKIQRRSRGLFFSVTDAATGVSSIINTPIGVYAAVGNLRLYTYGGTWWLLDNIKVKYDEHYRPDIVFMGDSWTYGGNALIEEGSFYFQSTSGFSAIRMAGPGETSLQGTYRFDDLIRANPKMALWLYGVNDLNGGGTGPNAALDSFCKRTIRFIVLCQSNNIIPVLATPGPQVTDAAKYVDSIRAIASRYGNVIVVPVYEKLKDPAAVYMDAKYFTNDNVHMNQIGHDDLYPLFRHIFDSVFVKTSPIHFQNIPHITNPRGTVVIDAYGNAGIQQSGSDKGYWWNRPSVTVSDLPQLANLYGQGTFWLFSDDVRITPIGSSISAAPYFRLNASGMTSVLGSLANGKFSYSPSAINFDAAPITLSNNTQFKPQNQPVDILTTGPATAGVGLRVNNVSATVPTTYAIADFKVNDSSKLRIGRNGGVLAWDTVKYAADYSASYDNRTLVDKGYVTSAITAAITGGAVVVDSLYKNGAGDSIVYSIQSRRHAILDRSGSTPAGGNGRNLQVNSASGFAGTGDSLLWALGQLYIPQFNTTTSSIRAGELAFQSFAINNSWLAQNCHYDGTSFKRLISGGYASMLYFNAGDIQFQTTTTTGAAGTTPTFIVPFTIKSNGKLGGLGVTPTAFLHLTPSQTGGAALRIPTGTAPTSPNEGDAWTTSGQWKFYNGSATRRMAQINDAAPTNGQIPIGNGTDFTNASITSTRRTVTVTPGAGTLNLDVNETLSVNATDVGNVGTGEDDLISYTIPAATLSTNNDRIEFEGVYQFIGANSKTLKIYFGSQLLTSVGAGTSVAFISAKGTIIRTGSATQRATVTIVTSSATYLYNVDISNPTETLSGTVVLKSTGTATTDNDIVQKSFIVKFFPAP